MVCIYSVLDSDDFDLVELQSSVFTPMYCELLLIIIFVVIKNQEVQGASQLLLTIFGD